MQLRIQDQQQEENKEQQQPPPPPPPPHHHQGFVELSHFFLMNIQRSNPINISRYGRSRHKSHDFEELSCLRTTESHQSFSPNLGSPSPPETPDSSHCISRIGDYLLLEPLEGDHVFRAAHLHSGEELVCKVSRHSNGTRLLRLLFFFDAPRIASLPLHTWVITFPVFLQVFSPSAFIVTG